MNLNYSTTPTAVLNDVLRVAGSRILSLQCSALRGAVDYVRSLPPLPPDEATGVKAPRHFLLPLVIVGQQIGTSVEFWDRNADLVHQLLQGSIYGKDGRHFAYFDVAEKSKRVTELEAAGYTVVIETDLAALAQLKRDLRQAQAERAAVPSLPAAPWSAAARWNASQRSRYQDRVSRARKALVAFRRQNRLGTPAKPWRPLPAKSCDERIKRQYHNIEATIKLYDAWVESCAIAA